MRQATDDNNCAVAMLRRETGSSLHACSRQAGKSSAGRDDDVREDAGTVRVSRIPKTYRVMIFALELSM
jgi:hypothetical protein